MHGRTQGPDIPCMTASVSGGWLSCIGPRCHAWNRCRFSSRDSKPSSHFSFEFESTMLELDAKKDRVGKHCVWLEKSWIEGAPAMHDNSQEMCPGTANFDAILQYHGSASLVGCTTGHHREGTGNLLRTRPRDHRTRGIANP